MSVTLTEIEQIRYLLGYPNQPHFTDRIAVAVNLNCSTDDCPTTKTLRTLLQEISKCDQQIRNVRPFAAETFSSGGAGTRQYAQSQRMAILKQEAENYIQQVATLLNIPIMRTPYAPAHQGRTMR